MKMLNALTLAALVMTSLSAPAFAATTVGDNFDLIAGLGDDGFDKRRKPRVPGGSGCDDPRDLIEHPECRP